MPAVYGRNTFVTRAIVALQALIAINAFRLPGRGLLPYFQRCVMLNTADLNSDRRSLHKIAVRDRIAGLQLSSVPQFLEVLPDNKWGLYAVIASSAAGALRLERKTAIGKSLSGPVTAMLISAILTNIGVLPPTGSIHLISLQVFVLKLATPLLLLAADMRKILGETGVMLKAFFLGTIGTLLGSFLAMILLSGPMSSIGMPGDSWKIASALTAKNIGGGLNFFAVADTVMVSKTTIATGLAVDNLLGLLYFPLISWIGAPYDENVKSVGISILDVKSEIVTEVAEDAVYSGRVGVEEFAADTAATVPSAAAVNAHISQISQSDSIDRNKGSGASAGEAPADDVEKITTVLALGLSLVAAADYLSSLSGFPSVPISTLLTVMMASAFPQQMQGLIPSGEMIGKVLLLLFFASVGNASGTVAGTFAAKGAGSLVAFEFILYAVHLSVVLGIGGKLLKIPMPDLLLASNANIGNAATASSLATAKGWKSRFLPAVLVGTLGNALGTFAGLTMGTVVLKKIAGW